MKWLVALLACIGIAQAQVIQHQISDDGHVRIPLQFPFPLYGRTFTDSFMYSNGVVGFGSVNNHWCCTGHDLRNARGYEFNFSIMPLQTDLVNYGQGRFLTEGTPQYQRYMWENISEFGVPGNLNTFGLEIKPSGHIGIHYEKINISPGRPITMGITGDTTQGEYTQFYHGPGYSSTAAPSHIVGSTGNLCLSNPLSDPSCPGYAEAYFTQQCAISPLYMASCPGYQQAYFTQQCSISPLYDRQCPNHAEAYYAQQCTLNALYDRDCPGYNEAYAIANIVAPTPIAISAPVLQISMTGGISVTTPIIADPVVNEVVTRPTPTANNSVSNARNPEPSSQPSSQPEKKTEEKKDSKSEPKPVAKPQVKTADAKSIEMPNMTPTPVKIEQVQLIDLLSRKMISKPLSTNARAYYLMTIGGQRSHEEMIDEQYRR
jgi:hypothetical protein